MAQSDTTNYLVQSRFIVKEKKVYLFKNKTFEYTELGAVFSDSPELLMYYEKALKKQIWAKRTTGLRIGSSVLTAFFLGLAESEGFGSVSYFQLVFSGVITLGFTLIMIPISIAQHSFKRKNRRKSIQSYNEQEITKDGYKKDSTYLQFGITRNGVGLALNF